MRNRYGILALLALIIVASLPSSALAANLSVTVQIPQSGALAKDTVVVVAIVDASTGNDVTYVVDRVGSKKPPYIVSVPVTLVANKTYRIEAEVGRTPSRERLFEGQSTDFKLGDPVPPVSTHPSQGELSRFSSGLLILAIGLAFGVVAILLLGWRQLRRPQRMRLA